MKNVKPIFIMMCGLPASGKSYYAKNLSTEINAVVCSSDELREEMFGDINNQTNNHKLFNELHKRIKNYLRNGSNVIYDACNVNSKRRRSFIQELKNIDCVKECIIMATPYNQCLENNSNRDRTVPDDVIKRMYKQWETPYFYENFDRVSIEYWKGSCNGSLLPMSWALDYKNYNQDNPHHESTLGVHCMKAMYWLYDSEWFNHASIGTIINAALIHDCGKPFCKTFKNGKGEITNIAHYYGHEHVGAYDSLFFTYVAGISSLFVSAIISNHMKPYVWERDNNEKMYNKYLKLWGDYFMQCVMILHEADKAAH